MRPNWTYLFLGKKLKRILGQVFPRGMQLKIRIYPCNIRVINENDSHKYIYLFATSFEIVYVVNSNDSGRGLND